MDYKSSLMALGLNYTEVRVYTQLLDIGSGNIQEISRKTGLKRTTTYSVLDNLIQKKMVTLLQKGHQREYFAENPNKITRLLEDQETDLRRKKQMMVDALPELASMYNAHAKKPKIRFYEGDEAMKQAFEETLELPRGSETLAYSNASELPSKLVQEFMPGYIKRRVAKGIYQRAIGEYSTYLSDMQKRDKQELRNMVLIDSKKFPLHDQVNIYGNKIFIVSFKDKLTLIIESEAIVNTQRSFFELAWIGAQQVGKTSPDPYIAPKKQATRPKKH